MELFIAFCCSWACVLSLPSAAAAWKAVSRVSPVLNRTKKLETDLFRLPAALVDGRGSKSNSSSTSHGSFNFKVFKLFCEFPFVIRKIKNNFQISIIKQISPGKKHID
ncbi:MAG: hypothetical protein IKE25_11480, partial [Clostridia bacterium]|nr:hypothetical protein [Clostridia bacterium]